MVAIVLRDECHFKAGDVLGLLMSNRPEYVAIWLGAAKLGCVTALINTNVRLESLTHSLNAANCRALVFDNDHILAVREIRDRLADVGVSNCMHWDTSGKGVDSIPDFPECRSFKNEVERVKQNDALAVRSFQYYEGDPKGILYLTRI